VVYFCKFKIFFHKTAEADRRQRAKQYSPIRRASNYIHRPSDAQKASDDSFSVRGHLSSAQHLSALRRAQWQDDCRRPRQLAASILLEFVICAASTLWSRTIYQPVRFKTYSALPFVKKNTDCSPTWSGICSANDRARQDTFLRRSKRHGYCSDDIPTTCKLFYCSWSVSVWASTSPEETNKSYNLHPCQHDRQLTRKSFRLNDCLFIIRMLYEDSDSFYRVFYSLHLSLAFLFACTLVAICQLEFIRIYGYEYMVIKWVDLVRNTVYWINNSNFHCLMNSDNVLSLFHWRILV